MEKFSRPKGTLLALFMFLPITPSIATITVFTSSVISDNTKELISIPPLSKYNQRLNKIN